MGAEGTPKRSVFFKVRVGLLLAALVLVVLYAIRDVRSRRARTEWDHTLSIALVLVEQRPLAAGVTPALRARVPSLEERMTSELHRHRPDAPTPFTFRFVGPVTYPDPPPTPDGDGIADLAAHAYRTWRWTQAVDGAAGESLSGYDSRIYLVARPPASEERQVVEGVSQDGGRIGIVSVELDADMADLALIVVAHELFHTLGATDKYDASGRIKVPEGLAEPQLRPVLPQRYAEIMARNRPVSVAEEKVPTRLDEIAVGLVTASEIGWLR